MAKTRLKQGCPYLQFSIFPKIPYQLLVKCISNFNRKLNLHWQSHAAQEKNGHILRIRGYFPVIPGKTQTLRGSFDLHQLFLWHKSEKAGLILQVPGRGLGYSRDLLHCYAVPFSRSHSTLLTPKCSLPRSLPPSPTLCHSASLFH